MIFPFPLDQWQAGTFRGVDSNENNQTSAGDVLTSRWPDKLKPIYLHYHSSCGHQAWQDSDWPWGAITHNVGLNFSHMVLQDHLKNKKTASLSMLMASRLYRMVAVIEGLLPIMLPHPLVMWSCKILRQTENITTTTKLGTMVTNFQGLLSKV